MVTVIVITVLRRAEAKWSGNMGMKVPVSTGRCNVAVIWFVHGFPLLIIEVTGVQFSPIS